MFGDKSEFDWEMRREKEENDEGEPEEAVTEERGLFVLMSSILAASCFAVSAHKQGVPSAQKPHRSTGSDGLPNGPASEE